MEQIFPNFSCVNSHSENTDTALPWLFVFMKEQFNIFYVYFYRYYILIKLFILDLFMDIYQ